MRKYVLAGICLAWANCGSAWGQISPGTPQAQNLLIQKSLNQELNKLRKNPTQTLTIDPNRGSSLYQLSLGQALSVTAITHPVDVDLDSLDERMRAIIGSRILRGKLAQPQQFPWQVALLNSQSGNLFCSGSHIGDGWIVTAAHCFKDSPNRVQLTRTGLVVLYGTSSLVSGGTRAFPIIEPLLHEQYDPRNLANDIALIKIPPNSLSAVPLPTAQEDQNELATSTPLNISGWGRTTENGNISVDLIFGVVPVTDASRCRTAYAQNFFVGGGQICAGGINPNDPDTCRGDSGGPLSHYNALTDKRTLLGITSYGEGCGRPNYPGVYTRIHAYADWIRKHTGVR